MDEVLRQEAIPCSRVWRSGRLGILALLLLLVAQVWIRRTELLGSTVQGSESVPPLPALAFLVLLVALRPLLRRLGRGWAWSVGEAQEVYAFLVLAVAVAGPGGIRCLFPSLTAPFYFATHEKEWARYQRDLPPFLVPLQPEVFQGFYEGADNGRVPWRPWLGPLTGWLLFLGAVWGSLACFLALFQEQWAEKERLTFPLLSLPLALTGRGTGSASPARAFFADPVAWSGLAVGSLYHGINVLHVFYPSLPAPGTRIDLGVWLTEAPLSALRPLSFYLRPDVVGLGFLAPLDLVFSVWFFYALLKGVSLGAYLLGYQATGFPFLTEQSGGAYLALAGFLLWTARGHLKRVLVLAVGRKVPPVRREEARFYRWTLGGTLGGAGLVLGLLAAAGLRWPVALLFFGLVAAFALVYARLRAEAGIPSLWVFPASQQNRLLLNALGAPFLTAGGDPRPLTVLALFSFLARGCFPQLTAYSMENLKMAGEQSPARAHLLRLAFLAMFVGLGVGGYVYLTTCYAYGANVLEGGTIEGGYQTRLARAEYAALGHGTFVPDYKPARAAASGAGLLMTTALLWLRFRFLWFPLHPLGYAMAASFGWVLWGPFLLVWLVKRIVLKRGGPRAYAGLVPAFVGLSLGHFLGGGLWGLLACRLENVYAQYQVWF